jgi:hypothetical protein
MPEAIFEQTREMPADLRTWFGENKLVHLSLEAVQETRPEKAGAEQAGYSHPMMLTLLTYCYASGLYGSRDIEFQARTDRTLKYLCAHNYPDWSAIRQFRRRHAETLKCCLLALYRLSEDHCRRREGSETGQAGSMMGFQERLRPFAAEEFSGEVEARLSRAIQADCMAMDE